MADSVELREARVEIRADPDKRSLTGVVMPYGTVSPTFRERFLPGSLRLAPRGLVHVQHDRSRPVAGWPGSVELRETAAGMEAEITLDDTPEGAAAIAGVQSGALTGFSVEFNRARFRHVAGIREISEAVLIGIGVVHAASYPGTRVELRARERRRVWIT